MSQPVYIVSALRTPTVKANGVFKNVRPDDLLSFVLNKIIQEQPSLEANVVDDVIAGCAMPEAEQGLNIARIALLLADYPDSVPGMTINRFCASGLQAISIAANQIKSGEADIVVAAGVESMSAIPMVGNSPAFNPKVFQNEHQSIAYGMGITAEEVAKRYQVSREQQDEYAFNSHQKAQHAQQQGWFDNEIRAFTTQHKSFDKKLSRVIEQSETIEKDNGIRADTTIEKLARLRAVFDQTGSVTAGNSSQMSDGAAAVLLCSEKALRTYQLTPIAKYWGFTVTGVAPEIMGIGPVKAVPKLLDYAQISINKIDHIELNEAFAAQSIAVIKQLDLDPEIVNPQGGAIALGHPLGATGAIRTATLVHSMQRQQHRYGMVTMCIGTGMGAAGLFERL